jgi:protein-L-isoaspartate O-methyltransferase
LRVDWEPAAARLAVGVTDPTSRWRPLVAATPRHVFVPRWWEREGTTDWTVRDGPASASDWLAAAYSDRSLVTRVGIAHADHARPGDHSQGRPTSSSTMPGLVVAMYRHATLTGDSDVLDVGTGSGYGAALLAARLGDRRVTSIDVDAYLARAATERLDAIGRHPEVITGDATGPLPGTYDRIVSMTSVAPVPPSWLAALRPGGRLVTTIAGTSLLVTADKVADGAATGRVEWYRAGFMEARTSPDYPPALLDTIPGARDGDGDDVTTGTYPVLDIGSSRELLSMLGVTIPGTDTHYEEDDRHRTAWLLHPDGSWARATATGDESPRIHQAGPRRLWSHLDSLRDQWLRDGALPVYGSAVIITPDGSITFRRGKWKATISASPPATR